MVPSGGRWPPGSQAMRGHSRDRSTSRYFPDGWISSRGSSGPRFQPFGEPVNSPDVIGRENIGANLTPFSWPAFSP
jgi:hypothetical protein